MTSRLRAIALALLAHAALAAGATAQTDYHNLDDGRPVRTEDAFPVDRYEFEAMLPFAFDADVGGADRWALLPELEYGVLPNTQFGIKLPVGVVDSGGSSTVGAAGLQLHGLYSFNAEGRSLPAFGARADLTLPVGALAGDEVRLTLKAIATRTFGLTRLHLNGAWTFGTGPDGPRLDALPRWFASIAVDRTFFRPSLLLVGELSTLQENPGAPTEVSVALGARWQATPTLVLDAGITRRLTSAAGPDFEFTLGLSHAFATRALMPRRADPADSALALRGARDEQFYYPGSFNWQFLHRYPDAARLFNAFDYGHATLYEHLLTTPAAKLTAALDREFVYLTRDLLLHPPRLGVPEQAIEPAYARIAWEAKVMFDWAHVLHRQIYDVYADPSLSVTAKDSLVEVLTDYYLSRGDVAFAAVPKSMALMDGQAFSGAFRRQQVRFNGLIWAYHWLQVGLYEPFLASDDPATQAAGVAAAVAHFRAMLVDPPAHMPATMPMTPGVAPEFSRRHPRAAIIFDNLHMMHDVISDILLSDLVPPDRKASAIAGQLSEFRNPSRNVTSVKEWREMGAMMNGTAPADPPH